MPSDRQSATAPSVSVVIPSYNAEAFIRKTINSVLAQTLQSLEVIVVDDCSSDSTVAVVESLARLDPRIRVVTLASNSNRPAVPRNFGLSAARGQYVAFLDHDDLWSPRKLERQLQVLNAGPRTVMVHSYMWRKTERSRLLGLLYMPNPLRKKGTLRQLLKYNSIQCSSVIARAEVLRELGGFNESPELRTVEDYELWIRMARIGQIAYVSEVHGYYMWSPAGAQAQEDWLARHKALDEATGASSVGGQPNRLWQVARKIVGFPLALYCHGIEGPLRMRLNARPRTW